MNILNSGQNRPFIKMQGLGNHFMIIDGRERVFRPKSDMITRLCSIHKGVGAEQLLVVEQASLPGAEARIRLYNSDGQEVEACGNATRCVARLLMDWSHKRQIVLEIANRLISCKQRDAMVEVDMGTVSFDYHQVPLAEPVDNFYPGHETLAANIGNPHVVVLVPELSNLDEKTRIAIGQKVQQHPALIDSANVGLVEIVSTNTVNLQVYERPGILTQACGSGACAAVAFAVSKGYIEPDKVTVQMPGGQLVIDCLESYNMMMTGPADYCYEGTFQEQQYA